MFIRTKANNEQVLLKKGNYKITGRMIDMRKDSWFMLTVAKARMTAKILFLK